jgi:hypothetical protein
MEIDFVDLFVRRGMVIFIVIGLIAISSFIGYIVYISKRK